MKKVKGLSHHGFPRETLELAFEHYVRRGEEGRALDVLAEYGVSGWHRLFLLLALRTAFRLLGHTAPEIVVSFYNLLIKHPNLPASQYRMRSTPFREVATVVLQLCRAKHTLVAFWKNFQAVRAKSDYRVFNGRLPDSYRRFFGDHNLANRLRAWMAMFCHALAEEMEVPAMHAASIIEVVSMRRGHDIGIPPIETYNCQQSPSNPIVNMNENLKNRPIALVYHRLANRAPDHALQPFFSAAAMAGTREALFASILYVLRPRSELQEVPDIGESRTTDAMRERPFAQEPRFFSTDSFDFMAGRVCFAPFERWVFDFRHSLKDGDKTENLEELFKNLKINLSLIERNRSHPQRSLVGIEKFWFSTFIREGTVLPNPHTVDLVISATMRQEVLFSSLLSKEELTLPYTYEKRHVEECIRDATVWNDMQKSNEKKFKPEPKKRKVKK